VKLHLKVIPGARQESHEWMDTERSELKIRVTAAPEKGKAKKAVELYLAAILDLPRKAINITSGHTSQQKTVEITGISPGK
jgi:uncharacterized protein YggU (UPF0235/DUF167 family)